VSNRLSLSVQVLLTELSKQYAKKLTDYSILAEMPPFLKGAGTELSKRIDNKKRWLFEFREKQSKKSFMKHKGIRAT
jgi:hypothetical protein